MKWKLIILLAVLVLISSISVVPRSDWVRPIGTSVGGSDIDENMYLNIENDYNRVVYLNISKSTKPTYSIKVREGRAWSFTGGEFK